MRTSDAIIIGAGQAGPPLAERLTKAGKSVVLIERKWFGGTCVNTGCMPTKAMVASAHTAHLASRAGEYGVVAHGVAVDMARVTARAHKITLDARAGVEDWVKGLDNCHVVQGHARLISSNEVKVEDEAFQAPLIILNVGARATIPEIPGLEDVAYLTNADMMRMSVLPAHLIILGGSYIALEFAQMYRRFGSSVTVIERGDRIAGREDEDISAAIRDILETEGVEILTGAKVQQIRPTAQGVEVDIEGRMITGTHCLVATGRKPNTDDLGLETAGVEIGERGHIMVGDDLQTNVAGIYALGDCNGRGAFTHTAYNDFEILAANLLDGEARKISDRIPAYALYIDPPLGRVGLTLAEAQKTGRNLLIGNRPMNRVGRAREKGETQGLMRLIADADTKEILGAAILGTGGDEAIHGILDLMNAKASYTQLQWAVPIHPTVSELWPTVMNEAQSVKNVK